jgi:hypothetical protein
MERDRKENRRYSYKQKSKKNPKDFDFELRDKTKIKKAFKHKKRHLEEDSWDNWEDEIH